MATWNTAEQIIAAHKMHDPPNEVMRGDGKFPYRPDIVSGSYIRLSSGDQSLAHALACPRQACPRPQRKYEAQIALENMEKQATTTAPVLAKWRLEALASRAQSHFAHLRSPVAVANCVLCRTSTVGCAVLGWALTVTSTNPTATYPINSPTSTPTFRTPDCPNDSSIGNTTAVSLEFSQELMG